MSETATRKDIDEVIDIMRDFMKQVDDRFNYSEERSRNFEEKIDSRFDSLDTRYDHLITTIDGFISRIDKYEVELVARDSQFARLLDWARKVSEKTGIPLENL